MNERDRGQWLVRASGQLHSMRAYRKLQSVLQMTEHGKVLCHLK
jgi:hypothetical protein